MDNFDLDAYCARIGLRGGRAADRLTLEAVCAAQPAQIPFENLDPLFGQVPALGLEALQDKLVRQRRGGYCFELNGLLHGALQAMGFEVTGLAARVLWMRPGDQPLPWRSHRLLCVRTQAARDADLLVDAGFGSQLLDAPLPLQAGAQQSTPSGRRRIVDAGGELQLEAELPAGWTPLYRFSREPLLPVDYEPLNWFVATRPGSLFRHNLILERLTGEQRIKLFNDRFTRHPHGQGPESRRLDDADGLRRVLEQDFGLALPQPARDISARIPRGLDGPFLPAG